MLVEILFPFPAMWLSSGLGVIIFVLAAGFYFGFYVIIHDSTEPCVGPLGGCGTISCTAGTYLPEVYVFMQLTLTLIPLLFVRQLWRTMMDTSPLIREQCKKDNDPQMLSSSSLKLIAQNMTPFQRFIVPAMIYGITATTLTGLFPARYAKNIYDDTSSTSNKRYDQYGDLHTYGVMIGVVVPVSCSFLYFCYHYFVRIPREQDPRFRYYAPGGFYCRAAHIGAVIVAYATSPRKYAHHACRCARLVLLTRAWDLPLCRAQFLRIPEQLDVAQYSRVLFRVQGPGQVRVVASQRRDVPLEDPPHELLL